MKKCSKVIKILCIVKTKNRNDRLVKELLTNNNFQNYMIHYLAEKIYAEANR